MSRSAPLSADLDVIKSLPVDDDPILAFRSEINSWVEMLTQHRKLDDPVFEGMVRHFNGTTSTLRRIMHGVDGMMAGVDSLCKAMVTLSEIFVTSFGKTKYKSISSDSCKFRECTNNICRADAPYSIIAKLKRDLRFNVREPLSAHLVHSQKLRAQLDSRRRRLQEFLEAKKELESQKRTVPPSRKRQLEDAVKRCRAAFEEVDKPVFEWLLMLQEYEADICDSLLQTVKYLQYEFFAGASHCLANVLPKRMEFRPLVEMTPKQLQPQVEMELNEERPGIETRLSPSAKKDRKKVDMNGTESSSPSPTSSASLSLDCCSTTTKILQRSMQGADTVLVQNAKPAGDGIPVDELSLSVLLAQGFEEAAARRALKLHGGSDAQAALDCLIGAHDHNEDPKELAREAEDEVTRQEVYDSVRIPSTLKWIQKLKKYRAKQQSRQRHHQREENSSSSSNGPEPEASSHSLLEGSSQLLPSPAPSSGGPSPRSQGRAAEPFFDLMTGDSSNQRDSLSHQQQQQASAVGPELRRGSQEDDASSRTSDTSVDVQ